MASKDLVVRLLGDASSLNQALGRVGTDAAHVGRTLTRTLTPAAAAVGVALTKIGSDWNDARDAIIVGTGASGEALESLIGSAKKVAGEVPNSFGDVGTAIADLNTRLGLTGPELETMAKKFLDLSRITKSDVSTNISNITRLFGDWGVATEDQARVLDLVFEATKRTGIGLDRLTQLTVQYGAPLRQLGFTMEDSIALFSAFEQQGVNTETVMAGLRQALSRLARAGEEPVEAFQRTVQAIKDAGSAGEANTLALELFGARAGPDMAAAIREGRFEIDELVARLNDSEGSLAYAADATLRLSDRFAILRNKVTALVGPFGEIGGAIAGGVAAIGPFIFGISTLTPALGSLTTMVKGLNLALLANPWVLAAAGIAALVAVSPELRAVLKDIFDALVPVIKSLMDALRPALETVGRVVGELARVMGEQLAKIVRDLAPLLEAFGQALVDVIEKVMPLVQASVDAAVALMDMAGAVDEFMKSIDPFPDLVNTAGEKAGLFGIVLGAVEDAINPLSGATDALNVVLGFLGLGADEASESLGEFAGAMPPAMHALDELGIIADLTGTKTGAFKSALEEAGIEAEDFAAVTSAAAKAAQDAMSREFKKIEDAAQSLARETESAARAAAGSFLKLSDEGKKNIDTFVEETIAGAMRLARFQDNVIRIASATSGDFANYLMAMGLDAEDLVNDLADPRKTAELQRSYDAWVKSTEIGARDMGAEFAKVDPAFKKVLDGVAGLTEKELQAIAKIAEREGRAVGQEMINGMNAGVIARSPQLAREVRQAVQRAIEAGRQQARASSPSKETRDKIGIPLAEGIAAGIAEGSSDVDQAMRSAVQDAIVPPTVAAGVSAQPAMAAAGGPSFQITVNAGMGADGADIGKRIVEEIKRYERFNGSRWRS